MSELEQPVEDAPERPAGHPWLRHAEVRDVSFPGRTIDLVVMPYETPAMVAYDGRMVQEVIDRAAFAGIERRANRVRVNREHDVLHTVGRAVAFHPNRDEGLVAELRIARTPMGDETLALAADGDLDASAAFLPMDGGLKWETRSAYRVTKAWLGHIAMTSDPAYPDARVLAVRNADGAPKLSPTPNLDVVRGWLLADSVASDPNLNR
jgi:HK97 family phage prohead protease